MTQRQAKIEKKERKKTAVRLSSIRPKFTCTSLCVYFHLVKWIVTLKHIQIKQMIYFNLYTKSHQFIIRRAGRRNGYISYVLLISLVIWKINLSSCEKWNLIEFTLKFITKK